MKKNMKKLLVIVMALMPSLSICTFAQTPGGGPESPDPELIPVKESPNPNPSPGPRFSPDGAGGSADDGGLIDLGLGGVHPRVAPGDYDDIPIVPFPDPTHGHEPRIRNTVQQPYCYHASGVVYIEADSSITHINATVTHCADNQVWSNAATTNTLIITASPATGEYLLQLTLSNNHSYIGKYTIE